MLHITFAKQLSKDTQYCTLVYTHHIHCRYTLLPTVCTVTVCVCLCACVGMYMCTQYTHHTGQCLYRVHVFVYKVPMCIVTVYVLVRTCVHTVYVVYIYCAYMCTQ